MQILIILYLALFPFGQLDRIETPLLTFHLTDVVVGGIAITYLFSKFKIKGNISYYLLSFGAIAIFSYLINFSGILIEDTLRGALYLVRFLSFIFFFFSIKEFIKEKENFKLTQNFLIYIGSLITFFALFQYILVPDTRALFHFGWDNHYYRAIGTFLDPSFLGLLLTLFILYLQSFENKKILLVIATIALVLTFSRSSFLALALGLLIFNLKSIQVKNTVLIIGVFVIALFLAPKPSGEGVNLSRTSTIYSRVDNYQLSWNKALERPLFGYGFNLLKIEGENNLHSKYGVDSSLLFVLLTTGVVGFFIFLSLIFQIIKYSWLGNSKISTVVLASTIAVLTHSLFQNSFFYPWILGWMFIILAIMEVENSNSVKQ